MSGLVYSIVNNTQESLAGNAVDLGSNGLQITAASGTTITGTIDLSEGKITGGVWDDGLNNGLFNGSGCRLN